MSGTNNVNQLLADAEESCPSTEELESVFDEITPDPLPTSGFSAACYFHGWSNNPESTCFVVSPHPVGEVGEDGVEKNARQPWKGLCKLYAPGYNGEALVPKVDFNFVPGQIIPNYVINYNRQVVDTKTGEPLRDSDGNAWLYWTKKRSAVNRSKYAKKKAPFSKDNPYTSGKKGNLTNNKKWSK